MNRGLNTHQTWRPRLATTRMRRGRSQSKRWCPWGRRVALRGTASGMGWVILLLRVMVDIRAMQVFRPVGAGGSEQLA